MSDHTSSTPETPAKSLSRYRWPRPLIVRPFGVTLVWLGLGWVVGVLLAPALGLGSMFVTVAGVVTVLIVLGGIYFVLRPPLVLALTPSAYRVHHVRGSGVPGAEWSDVDTAQVGDTVAGQALLIELKDGRRSIVPLLLLGAQANTAAKDVHDRLDSAYGYRPYSGSAETSGAPEPGDS